MFEWMVENDNDPLDIWETVDYQCIPIVNLSIPIVNLRDSHLEKIVEFLETHPGWRAEQKPRILAEVERRKKAKLAKTTKAGNLFYERN